MAPRKKSTASARGSEGMVSLLRDLCGTYGPSGDEDVVAARVRALVKGHVDSLRTDVMGNLFAHRKGRGARVLLAAHMDEIGLVVSFIDKKGFVRFSNVGGVKPDLLPSQRVQCRDGRIGVLMEEERGPKDGPKLDRIYGDFGFETGTEAAKHLQIGDTVCFHRELAVLGDRVVSKAMDDRVSCAVLVESIRRLKKTPNDVAYVFTVQEEVGCRGAGPAAYAYNPDVALSVDVTLTGDLPQGMPMAVSLGEGAAIKVKDGGHIGHPGVRALLLKLARKLKLKHQLEVLPLPGASTDASAIYRVREGVPSGCISVPCRYVHSVSEMVDLRDVEGAVQLLTAFLETDLRKEGF